MNVHTGLYNLERSESLAPKFGIYTMISELLKASGRLSVVPIQIAKLATKNLKFPILVLVEIDDEEVIATTTELPLYGSGDSAQEAVDMLKREIESLYYDLAADDEFTHDWSRIKSYLMNIVVESV